VPLEGTVSSDTSLKEMFIEINLILKELVTAVQNDKSLNGDSSVALYN
jgi:hypothetical protein